MLTSLALIFLTGLLLASLFEKLKLPRIIGMLLAGILLGPYVLNLLDDSVLSISSDLRQMALIIILFKAGLSLNLSDMKKGRSSCDSDVLCSRHIRDHRICSAGTDFARHFQNRGSSHGICARCRFPCRRHPAYGPAHGNELWHRKSIPQLIMAGASCDDIFVIVLFSTFSSMAQGGSANIMDFVNIPVSILLGIVIGAIIGYLLALFLKPATDRGIASAAV